MQSAVFSRMVIEMSWFSVGAVFLVILFVLALICVFGQRQKPSDGDNKAGKFNCIQLYTASNTLVSFFILCFYVVHFLAAKSTLLQYVNQFLCHSSPLSIPGPPSYFLIGNMMELTHNHLPIHLTSLAQRFGSIYRLKCGNTSNTFTFLYSSPLDVELQ